MPESEKIRSGGIKFETVAQYPQKPARSSLPAPIRTCSIIKRSFFERDYACGHRDSRAFRLNIFGMETGTIRQKDLCPNCQIEDGKKKIIFCALCGLPIIPGNGVAIYDDDNEGIRPDATHIGKSVLGYLRWECCPGGLLFAGHWTTEGFKPYDFKKHFRKHH